MTTTTTAPRTSLATTRAKRSSPAILRGRLKERDAARRDFAVQLAEDEGLADVARPEFFGLSADKLQPGDRIAVTAFEFAWWAELIVIDADESLRSVKTVTLLGPVDLRERIAQVPAHDLSAARIEQVGDQHRIVLGLNVIAAGFRSEREAKEHLAEIRSGRKATSKTPA